MLQLLDDERMSHIVGSFSAVCSPPISMMYKGRKRSSSKLRTMEIMGDGGASSNALDEDIWAGLLKISKSSEELWKDVYSVSLIVRFTTLFSLLSHTLSFIFILRHYSLSYIIHYIMYTLLSFIQS